MSDVLRAHSFSEVYYYMAVVPCEECGKGPWKVRRVSTESVAPQILAVTACCGACGLEKQFRFACDHGDLDIEPALNPTGLPSELIDPGQWLGLYDLMTLQAEQATTPTEAHLASCRATLCLEEALRFYDEDRELPEPESFFSHTSDLAFRRHPQQFARRRLIELHAKSHTPPAPTEQPGPRWWQFWRTDTEDAR